MTKRSMRLVAEDHNKKPEDSFFLGITQGWEEEEDPGRKAKKVKSVAGEENGSWRQAGRTDVRTAISKRKKCALSLRPCSKFTKGNRQKNVQHSEIVGLDNPKLGCLTPKGQMSANSLRTKFVVPFKYVRIRLTNNYNTPFVSVLLSSPCS